MSSRFVSNLTVILAAALLASLRFTFPGRPLTWLGFGAGCLVVAAVAGAFLVRGRGLVQRMLDVVAVAVGGWTVVSSLAFGHVTVGWLTLAEGMALVIVATGGMIAHEIALEQAIRRARRDACSAAESIDARSSWRDSATVARRAS